MLTFWQNFKIFFNIAIVFDLWFIRHILRSLLLLLELSRLFALHSCSSNLVSIFLYQAYSSTFFPLSIEYFSNYLSVSQVIHVTLDNKIYVIIQKFLSICEVHQLYCSWLDYRSVSTWYLIYSIVMKNVKPFYYKTLHPI